MANLLDIREILDVNSFQKIQDDIAKATEFAMKQAMKRAQKKMKKGKKKR